MSDLAYTRVRIVDAQPLATEFQPMVGHSEEPNLWLGSVGDDGEQRNGDISTEPNTLQAAFESGLRAAEARFSAEREQLLHLIASAEALQAEPSEELAALISTTVMTLVGQIVSEAPVNQMWLTDRAKSAAALVSECDNARTMHVHPNDLELLNGVALPLALVADADAARGSIRIDCSAGWIESGTALYLEALRVNLGLREATR
jgi:flagellar assembly protein FliH